jgi:DNA-binding response OmpR family regulator
MLQEFLQLQGLGVDVTHDAETALQLVAASPPDLVVLDVMLPGMSGFEALKKIREIRDVPVIMLTARGDEPERILGLLQGADDYLPKPCSPLELALRIKTVLKRIGGAAERAKSRADESALTVGPLHLDLKRREVHANQHKLQLTAGEMRILEQLMRRPGEVLSRAQLTQLALDRPLEAYDRSIDTLISKLRRKLEAAGVDGRCLGGLRGHGYVLDPERLSPA